MKRLGEWLVQVGIAIDQLVYVLVAGPFYWLLRRGICPSADETISSRVGRAAQEGKRWGIVLEWVIDHSFMLFGSKPGHCQRAIETAFLGMAPK
jgi:hypothetical protein